MIVVKTKGRVHFINEMNVAHLEFDTDMHEVCFRSGLDMVYIQEVTSVEYYAGDSLAWQGIKMRSYED